MEFLVGVGASIIGKIGEYTIVWAGRHVGYLFHYNRNVDDCNTQIQQLHYAKERLQHSVDMARRNLEEIEADVEDWLRQSLEITEEAEKFIQKEDQANTRCRNWMFPNLVLRHQLSRKAKKMALKAAKMKNNACTFDRVSYVLTVPCIPENKGYEDFETRKSTFTGIINALKDPNVSLIGITGMAGIGKTMLAKEVHKKALEEEVFKVVVMVTVSQTPDLEKIQEEIAKKLFLRIEETSMSLRAEKLQRRLRQEKDILIILDDIWEKFDLQHVGISFTEDQRGCKIVMTSRFQDLLCDEMDVGENFHVGVLSDGEATDLFNNIIGDTMRNTDFQSLAASIVEECAGLPIAITTVASALKKKNLFAWKDALTQLQRSSPTHVTNMHKNVYNGIRLSYDFLQSDEAQSIFLLCCLHEEDANIGIKDLLRYGCGLGLFHHVYYLEEAKCRLYTLLIKLKARGLLLDGNDKWSVKIHDVTRDVGLIIASEDKHMFNIRSNVELEKYRKEKRIENSIAISLIYNDVNYLPEKLECAQLLLILAWKSEGLQVPDDFFEEKRKLKVLDLSFAYLKPLPSSFRFLRSLQSLCLRNCKLGNPAIIGELENLEVLDFSYSSIDVLPKEIGQLTHLWLLDISFCRDLKVIQSDVISKLTRLEELNMRMSLDIQWKVEGGRDGETNNASLSELKDLFNLKTLYLDLRDDSMLPKGLVYDKLDAFNISICYHKVFVKFITIRESSEAFKPLSLKVNLNRRCLLDEYGLAVLLKRSEVLYLQGLEDVGSVAYELDADGFPELKYLSFTCNEQIKYIVDTMLQIDPPCAFPSLENLILAEMENLEKICNGLPPPESFCKLQFIQVIDCPNLKELFSFSTARWLLQVKEIEVYNCHMIETIVTNDCQGVIQAGAFPLLGSLKIRYAPKLLHFFSAAQNQPFFGVKNLAELTVESCGSLRCLLSSFVAANLVQLHKLHIKKCEMMEEIMTVDQRMDKIVFPKLTCLVLGSLPNLTRFCSEILIEFPLLTNLELYNCPKLMTFISSPAYTIVADNSLSNATFSLFSDKVRF
ncbi:hypothetical protein UlMin_012276 [Ulmus minor]